MSTPLYNPQADPDDTACRRVPSAPVLAVIGVFALLVLAVIAGVGWLVWVAIESKAVTP